jgi:hypothetical protein
MGDLTNSRMITIADWDGNLYRIPRALLEHYRLPEVTSVWSTTTGMLVRTRIGLRRDAGRYGYGSPLLVREPIRQTPYVAPRGPKPRRLSTGGRSARSAPNNCLLVGIISSHNSPSIR